MAGALAAFAASGALAAPIFTATAEGDWFDGASWSGGVAPAAADAPVVDNGGTAVASSSSPLYPGPGAAIEVQSLAVGSRLDASAPADSSGAVQLQDVDLALAGNLWIGADGIANEGMVSGSVALLGGDQTAGNLTAAETFVGVLGPPFLDSGASSAFGSLIVGGDLAAKRYLEVGVADGTSAAASGTVQVGGDLRIAAEPVSEQYAGFALVRVGQSRAFEAPAETTTGVLSVAGNLEVTDNADNALTRLEVGNASGGHAEGRVDVGGDMLGFRALLVGVATPGVDSFASGELHVAGTLGDASSPGGSGVVSSVGETGSNLFGGIASAEGIAAIGHLGTRLNFNVGVANGGPAIGSLTIGSGDLLTVNVGQSTSDFDASGTVTTGGGMTSVTVGASQGGGQRVYDPATGTWTRTPYTIGDAVGSVIAGGYTGKAVVGYVVSDGSANGHLEVEGVQLTSGSSFRGPVSVGVNLAGSGSATGEMLVRSGGITATTVAVGTTEASGTASGLLESSGDVSTISSSDAVGYAGTSATGDADGTWILHDAHYSSRKLAVGLSLGAGIATGRLELDESRADIVDLTLGAGATVALDIRDLLAYSAIHAGVARLDGVLEVGFVGPAQLGVYDLIVSGGADGITGGFDAVSIAGLAAGQQAFWGVETVGDTSPVEVFRLHVVPEPATGGLLALGLLGVAVRCRRARESPL